MAVVSDAWPDLPRLRATLGIHHFFEAYAISAEPGCNKPDPRMYHHASTALGLTPRQCLFIDDDPDLVQAAIDLAYAGRLPPQPAVMRMPQQETTALRSLRRKVAFPGIGAGRCVWGCTFRSGMWSG
ncbi:HAD-IA family hydrolase [Streptomyces sp. NPDC052114]|uniref:HAD-IA family hydrolase n=1 Tax=unclassified Streptomyces TaxID=2593676 RepID=UPI003416F9FB